MDIEGEQRQLHLSRRLMGPLRNGVCTFALTLALAAAVGAAPAAARSRHGHPPEHRDHAHAANEPFGDIPKGPLQIVISIDQQKLHLYSDGVPVAETSVATGVPGLPTPYGVFSVIQKQVFHRSNIYSGAPMPFMERITWSGVAMHEGEGIGHRASHGCIRMPRDFAVRLYHLTKLGVPVYIERGELRPQEFADPHLFAHRDPPPPPVAAAPVAAPAAGSAGDPLTRTKVASVASGAVDLGLGVKDIKPVAATAMIDGIGKGDSAAQDTAKSSPVTAPPQPATAAESHDPASVANPPPAASAAPTASPAAAPAVAPADQVAAAPINKDPIAIFISRKEKKIYVRQDFAPLFEAPVTIADSDKPLGTHVFTALQFTGDDHTTLRWNVVSFPAERAAEPRRRPEWEWRYDRYGRLIRHREDREMPKVEAPAPETPAEALARIDIPQDTMAAIARLIQPGSSLIVSDHGLGGETGEGTNFIVTMR